MAEVCFEHVSKVYPGGVHAVDRFDLRLGDGEFMALVGPSGCGKTTLLRMLAGLESASDGIVRIGPRAVNGVPVQDRDVAMVFQNHVLYPHMTVFGNMAFGLKMRRLKRAEIDRRVRWAADLLGIQSLLDRKPKTLSGGQCRRVAVGRAIVRRPKAYLFDEPLAGLDARLRVHTRAELKRLHQQLQITTLYVTHDQEEAMTLGDRVAVMDHGRLQQVDTPAVVYDRPANRFVAGFLGMPPMNFLDGTLADENGGVWFEGAAARIPLPDNIGCLLAKHLRSPVVLGIRPDAIQFSDRARSATAFPVTINLVEPLGNATDVFGATPAGTSIVARVKADRALRPGEQLAATVDPLGLHVFQPGEYGINLTARQAPPRV